MGSLGRIQWLVIIVNSVARNMNNYLYYPFAYLVLEQQFLCRFSSDSSFSQCSAESICSAKQDPQSTLVYKVDTSYDYYIDNWFLQMDLMCVSKSTVGLIITAYYIGFACGAVFYSCPEKYGRKWPMVWSTIVSLVAQTAIIFCSNFYVRMAGFYLMGLSQIRNSVSYVWASECVPLPKKSIVFTIINLVDAIPVTVTCLYFRYVSKDWYTLNFYQLVICYIAFIAMFMCPESPRWLLINGKSAEAINVLNHMAKMNGSSNPIPSDAKFVEDPTAYVEPDALAAGERRLSFAQDVTVTNNS